ncbi:MAG: CRTAC1 family protein [Acidobacteria bacterium]|nr:MAG: CRTAC1 family protein [Acidobacteriota bacterium]
MESAKRRRKGLGARSPGFCSSVTTRLFLAAAGLLACLGFLINPDAVQSAAGLIRFTDVAARSKFSYTSNNNFTGRKYFPQPMCGGIAVLDYDRDGKQDLFFTNGAKLPELKKTDSSFYNCLLRNKGDGTFEDVTEKAGVAGANLDFCFGVTTGDYDNDGDTDLFICNAGPNALYRNNGDGTFTEVTAGSGLDGKPKDLLSVCAAFFDYDNDRLLDLVVSQYTYWNPNTDKPCVHEKNEFYCNPATVVSVPHTLYRNLGNGKFEDVTARSGFASAAGKGMGIGIADFNGDDKVDVFVANDTIQNFLFLNRGNGTFEESSLLYGVAYNEAVAIVSGMGCDVKDYDNDGWVDVFYNNLQSQIFALFHNEKGEYFEYVSPTTNVATLSRRFSGWSNGFIDYDNDGWKDIYSSNGHVDYVGSPNPAQSDTMWQNQTGKNFTDVSSTLGPDFARVGYQRGSAFADLNNDGWQDLIVTSLNERPRIMLNSGNGSSHWLLLDLAGTASSRDAIGTKLKLTTGSGRKLYSHVSVSVGFMSASDRRIHFGLGEEKVIKSIEIRWPSGKTQTLGEVKVDQVLKVEEPKG